MPSTIEFTLLSSVTPSPFLLAMRERMAVSTPENFCCRAAKICSIIVILVCVLCENTKKKRLPEFGLVEALKQLVLMFLFGRNSLVVPLYSAAFLLFFYLFHLFINTVSVAGEQDSVLL